MSFIQFWSESIDPSTVVIVAFQSVAMSNASCLLKGYSAAAIPRLPVLILDTLEFFGEATLIHIEVQAVHSN